MPYIKEQFTNTTRRAEVYFNGVLQGAALGAQESVELTGFRSRPHSDAVFSQEISASTIDPYAYFLESTSGKKYRDRLNERGLQPKGDPDRGHAFELKRHIEINPPSDVVFRRVDIASNWTYKGGFVYPLISSAASTRLSSVHGGSVGTPTPYKETGLDVFAQQAYLKSAPTSVVFDAAQFLGELQEGLPGLSMHAIKSKLDAVRRVGNGYLLSEFGWKPFVRDLQNAAKALLGATNDLAQQGQRVHRRFSLPATNQYDTVTETRPLYVSSGLSRGVATNDKTLVTGSVYPNSLLCDAEATFTKTRRSNRWFEGEFTSFLPLGFDPSSFIERANVLINTKMTPSVLWELTPWSWLIDWQLRIGDTIRANEFAANDLLIMHYGYAMEETVYSTETSWRRLTSPPAQYYATVGLPQKGSSQSMTTYKRRLRANPYGFRVGGAGSLTGNQYAILGALGLTKLK